MKSLITRTWRISPKNEQRKISEGDIIKFGRVRLKFDRICTSGFAQQTNLTLSTKLVNKNNSVLHNHPYINHFQDQSYNSIHVQSNNYNLCHSCTNVNNSQNFSGNNSINNEHNQSANEFHKSESNYSFSKFNCRICYSSICDENDPLISPCKCTGSMSYIHYQCLKKCIESKMQKKEEDCYKFYTWKSFECEICKAEYPKLIIINHKIYPTVDMDITYDEYAVCDYSLFDDTKKKICRKGIIVFKLTENKEISVGRTHSNIIKLKDISVSRVHCSILKKKNCLYLIDKGSKFGSLFYLKNDLLLDTEHYNTISVDLISGKFKFCIEAIQTWSFFPNVFKCFCCSYKNNADQDIFFDSDNEEENSKIKNDNKLIKKNETSNEQMNFCTFPQGDESFEDSYEDIIMQINNFININDK